MEHGIFTADVANRTLRGLLIPFGETSRPNLSGNKPIRFTRGTVQSPADPSVVTLNRRHDRFDPVGRASLLEERDAGIYAEFAIARTPEGDQILAEHANGAGLRRLSGELADIVRRGVDAVRSRLAGAALVDEGSFESAALFALGDVDELELEEPAPIVSSRYESSFTDADGRKWQRVEESTSETTETDDGQTTVTTTVVTESEAADAAEQETAQMSTLTAPKAGGVTAAIDNAIVEEIEAPDARAVFSAIAAFRSGNGTAREAAETMLAALTDIKTSGATEMPTGGVAIQPDWVGLLFNGKRYQRKYWSLLKAGTEISLGGKKGYNLNRGTLASPVAHYTADWAGNKTDINSGTGHTKSIASNLYRYAYGNDIAREFFDLPGGMEMIEAFFELLREDYLIWSDGKALAAIVAAAGTKKAPDTYPADITKAHGQIAQGMVELTDLVNPSFAILNKTGFKELLYSPRDKVPEYIAFNVGTIGTGQAEGKVQVVWAADAIFTAAGITAGTATIVGGREAIEVDELGEVPLTIDALEIAKGGVDRAVHGYAQTFVPYAAGTILIGA